MHKPDEVSADWFHDGHVQVLQPKSGYRAAIDPVILAAALDRPRQGHRLLDVGCGAGVAGLCAMSLARTLTEGEPGTVSLKGIDIDRGMLDLASHSIGLNGFDMEGFSMRAEWADIAEPSSWLEQGCWDQVFSNPPYLQASAADGKARPDFETANRETTVPLAEWIGFMTEMVKPKSRLVLVHRADRLTEIVAAFRQRGVGGIEIFPLWPKSETPAKRVIVRGRKGVRTGDRLLPGLILHEADGSYTAEATAVLNGQTRLKF